MMMGGNVLPDESTVAHSNCREKQPGRLAVSLVASHIYYIATENYGLDSFLYILRV
jgi:hypothetical protein